MRMRRVENNRFARKNSQVENRLYVCLVFFAQFDEELPPADGTRPGFV